MVQSAGEWADSGMKPKRMFYTAVGFVTYKVGKRVAKRKASRALHGESSDKGA